MDIRPYLIVPKLIPQPTWGGEYITSNKKLKDELFHSLLIGQSYELSAQSLLSRVTDSDDLPIEIADPTTGETLDILGGTSTTFALQDFVATNPETILGRSYTSVHGDKMQILIKFTQAKGNSFQVHVRPGAEFKHWKAKPGSWYFLEDGKATIGLLDPTAERIQLYKQVCQKISAYISTVTKQLQQGEKTPGQAKVDIAAYIQDNSPYQFVQTHSVPKNACVDLSQGGIHHSWKESSDLPDGNIVYEVQVDVMDNECTIRSFDKGKIGDDGSLRPLHVDDYFTALDTDPVRNDVSSLIHARGENTIFDTQYYNTTKQTSLTSTEPFFRHVFVQEGEVTVNSIHVRKGASIFIPGNITIQSQVSGTLLQSYL